MINDEEINVNVRTLATTDFVEDNKTEDVLPDNPVNNGCGGSAIASIFGLLTLAGTTIVLRKRKEVNLVNT